MMNKYIRKDVHIPKLKFWGVTDCQITHVHVLDRQGSLNIGIAYQIIYPKILMMNRSE